MKKFFILFAAVAMMAMTACNEKPAKTEAQDANAPATENVQADSASAVKVAPMEKPKPTADGKDHTVAKFNTDDYTVTVENLADGAYRVKLIKDGKEDKVYETKNCRIQGNAYILQTEDGKNVLINADKGQIVVMDKKEIIYKGQSSK